MPESHIKFKDLNQVRPTDTKSPFKIKLVDSNVLDKKGNPKVLTYDNFLKHIDDNQKLYRTDSKTALQEYKKKRFIQENPDLRDQFNKKLNKAYDPTSRTNRAVFSPMHIHHTAGRGRNAFNVQFAVGTENMQENASRRSFKKNFAKAKNFSEQRAALKKYLDNVPPNLEVRLKNTPYGQRETLIDMTKRVAPELEQQVRAAGGAELGSIDRQLLADAAKFAGRAAQAAFVTPTGVAASTLGLGGLDLTSPVGRIVLGAELAGAPELVKASIGATKGIKNRALQKGIQQFLNLGLPTRLALKAARVASPLGIALTTGEGLYQAGKFAKKRMDELQAMSPEQRQALRARQAAFAFEGAREGGIIGKKSGPPPVSGPMPHGLPYETKGVKKQ